MATLSFNAKDALAVNLVDPAAATEVINLLAGVKTAGQTITVTPSVGSLPTVTGAVTVANTATPTVVELLKYCTELKAKLDALIATVG